MIDNSYTQSGNVGPIRNALNKYFQVNQQDNMNICYDYFSLTVNKGGCANNTINFDIPSSRWTNINAAYRAITRETADVKVLISDGIPSVDDRTMNGHPLTCVYDTGGARLAGCDPVPNIHEFDDIKACNSNPTYKRGGPQKLEDACLAPYPVGTANADVVVEVGGAEGANSANLLQAKKNKAKDNLYFVGMNSFADALPDILNFACKRTGSIPNRQPNPPGEPSGRGVVPFSFSMTNVTTDKTIDSATFKLCDVTDGENCTVTDVPVDLSPGQTVSQSNTLVVPTTFMTNTNQYIATCQLNYSDGSQQQCAQYNVNANDGVRIDLTAQDDSLADAAQSYSDLADINHDGIVENGVYRPVINSIDLALCFANVGQDPKNNQNNANIVADDVIDMLDCSVVIANWK